MDFQIAISAIIIIYDCSQDKNPYKLKMIFLTVGSCRLAGIQHVQSPSGSNVCEAVLYQQSWICWRIACTVLQQNSARSNHCILIISIPVLTCRGFRRRFSFTASFSSIPRAEITHPEWPHFNIDILVTPLCVSSSELYNPPRISKQIDRAST